MHPLLVNLRFLMVTIVLLGLGEPWSRSSDAWPAPFTASLAPDQSRSATVRRLAKPVLESRPLDGMESPAHWVHFGPGQMTFTGDRFREGRQSVRLTSPT
ncbi:MAG: hypothetical protein ACYC23_25000, partial [Limisphaerales bacterium]